MAPLGLSEVSGSEKMLWWFRVRGTVLMTIWWKVLLVMCWTFLVLLVHTFVCSLDFPQTLIPIVGVVVSLLLGFRNNSAYDRYWEGRKVWAQMTQDVRKLTRGIWAGVEERSPKSILEKKSALNLVLAFVIATKHYLREEYSDQYEDLKILIGHLPRFNTHPSIKPPEVSEKKNKMAARTARLKAYDHPTPTKIPIELSYYILSYIKYVIEDNSAPSWAVSTMQASLANLVDAFSTFERILRTPIPMAYSIHLHISVWIYILSLPFQIIGTVGWMAILVVGLGSFCLLGILAVAYEIENPFGYDENDLPLDDFCDVIRIEMDMITSSPLVKANEWMHAEENKPLAPASMSGSRSLSLKEKAEIQQILNEAYAMNFTEPNSSQFQEKSKEE